MKTDARTKKRENETLYILKVWATFSVIAIHFGIQSNFCSNWLVSNTTMVLICITVCLYLSIFFK